MHQDPDDFHHEDLDGENLYDEFGRPVYEGTGLSVRALTGEELQRFLDAHAEPARPVAGQRLGRPRPTRAPPRGSPDPSSRDHANAGRAGHRQPRQPRAFRPGEYRRHRALDLAGWTRSLAWRGPLVAATGLLGQVLAAQAGLQQVGLLGLAVAALVGWRLRFRPSEQARTWQRGAQGERHTARLLDRLTRDGYVVFHDLAVPDSPANLDHLVIGPSGVFVIDSKQWTGSVHQGADGLAWHNHYRLDRTLETVRWEASRSAVCSAAGPRRCCASTAPTSTAAVCTPRAWRSCPPTCSAARSATTGCCQTPMSPCSLPAP